MTKLTYCGECGEVTYPYNGRECEHCEGEFCLDCIEEHEKHCPDNILVRVIPFDILVLREMDENLIVHFKTSIKQKGYGYIKQRFDKETHNDLGLGEFSHLLSIAWWEWLYEGGVVPKDIILSQCCGLCLYHSSKKHIIEVSKNREEADCVIKDSGYNCCKEIEKVKEDKGKSLIQRLRREFIKRYYMKEKCMGLNNIKPKKYTQTPYLSKTSDKCGCEFVEVETTGESK